MGGCICDVYVLFGGNVWFDDASEDKIEVRVPRKCAMLEGC